MPGPLGHIRVLDLSRVLAAPWAGQMLADFGAEVIKIERPGEGDDTRGWGPPFITNADGSRGDAAYYLSTNRGKKSLAIDITASEGQDLIRKIAARSDILLENFKVGGLKKYGLDYQTVKGQNPSLIYCSVTGFGQDGPYAQRAGYDFIIQAMGGIMSITGKPDTEPGGGPVKCGVAFADLFTGLYAVAGILAALVHRERTGEGQHIDLALLDTQVAVLANQALNYLVSGRPPPRLGNAHPNIVPYQSFATRDGHVILAVGTDRQFRELCRIAELPGLPDDPRFLNNRTRVENRDALVSLLSPAMLGRTTKEWVEALEAAAVPCGPMNSIDQVFADPQVRHRGMQLDLYRDDGVKTPGLANPIRFSKTAITYERPAPSLNADADEILASILGLNQMEIAKLRKAGVVG
ncbi:MAG TPA: CaiB/BaiF CoA-transferase family protein [Aestuariivirgaceae bacterium]